MDLRERLEKIESLKKKVQQISHNHRGRNFHVPQDRKPVTISEILDGNTIDTPHGPCFYTEKKFPLYTSFGDFSFLDAEQYFPGNANIYTPKADNISINQTLFFDTETTGLAGGAGTYIFLIGLGFFSGQEFCVRQYFMSDYNEEEAFLWAINQLFAQDFKMLVSYNGKCYDFPLMQTRFIMTRLPLQLNDDYHLDLLFPTRRLWKRRLQDCSLSNIESKILNISRDGDIPGYLIPHIYFRYLQNRDARPLKPIFAHNLQDILSLVVLMTKIGKVLQNPFNSDMKINGIDLYSIGRIFEGSKDYKYSIRCYKEALDCNLTDKESLEVLRLCSFTYKKQGRWEEAETAWYNIISLSKEFVFYPYEELAKYYEHRLKDYSKALDTVKEALSRVKNENIDLESRDIWQQGLAYRLKRIKKKYKNLSKYKDPK